MKHKELNDFKTKNIEGLKKEVTRLTKEKKEAEIEHDVNKSKNVHKILQIRRDIAQISTLISEKVFTQKPTNTKGETSASN